MLLKIRQAAFDKVYAIKGEETPTEVAAAWFEAVMEQLEREGFTVLSAGLKARMLAAYTASPDDYIDAVDTVAKAISKPASLFDCDDHERVLTLFQVNVGNKEYLNE